eukprot:13390105-Alexandrium_andersonii.AAC.1
MGVSIGEHDKWALKSMLLGDGGSPAPPVLERLSPCAGEGRMDHEERNANTGRVDARKEPAGVGTDE